MNDGKEALRIVRNLIRVGRVNSVNPKQGTVRVLFEDRDNLISEELFLLDHEYNIPEVGDQVLCLFLGNGIEQGFCLNGFYSSINPPPVRDKHLYYKKFGDGTYIQYNKQTRVLEITSVEPIVLKGNFIIEGDARVRGNLKVDGTINGS